VFFQLICKEYLNTDWFVPYLPLQIISWQRCLTHHRVQQVNFDAWMADALPFSSCVMANKIAQMVLMKLTVVSMYDCIRWSQPLISAIKYVQNVIQRTQSVLKDITVIHSERLETRNT